MAKERAPRKSFYLKLPPNLFDALTELAEVNRRSKTQLVEMLIEEAALELKYDKSARINPVGGRL